MLRSPFVWLVGVILLLSGGSGDSTAGTHPESEGLFYDDTLESIADAAGISDSNERTERLDAIWQDLTQRQLFPLIEGERCAFLYRGEAQQLGIAGDFNGWDPANGPAQRLGESDVWILETSFPLDARLDYKIVINGGDWRLDPDNPLHQVGGFGPNSELRMPDYVPSPWVERSEGAPRGSMQGPRAIVSSNLGYSVRFLVYLPAGYEELEDLPSIYLTDGHEYALDEMGSMVVVLDNLIAEGLIEPVIAVFVDPRVSGQNRRADQYIMSPRFADFVADELVPLIDTDYKTSTRREDRAILGTSLGGLNSAWFGYQRPETFHLIAMQSPAFQAGGGQILNLYRESDRLDLRMYMTWGTFNDFGDTSEQMLGILQSKGYDLTTAVRNEGHSWGQWKALLDELLIHFWGHE